jgi:hypothetical protein
VEETQCIPDDQSFQEIEMFAALSCAEKWDLHGSERNACRVKKG